MFWKSLVGETYWQPVLVDIVAITSIPWHSNPERAVNFFTDQRKWDQKLVPPKPNLSKAAQNHTKSGKEDMVCRQADDFDQYLISFEILHNELKFGVGIFQRQRCPEPPSRLKPPKEYPKIQRSAGTICRDGEHFSERHFIG